MQKLTDLYNTMRVHLEALPVVVEALADLLVIAARQEEALKFYADRTHYIDGVAHLCDDEGLRTIPDDEGYVARQALGQDHALSAAIIKVTRAQLAGKKEAA